MESYQRLEAKWAEFNWLDPTGMVACSSGTAALHLALEAMQLVQGGEVLVPDFTMVACPRAVVLAGLTPSFVDCDDRLLMHMPHIPMRLPYPVAIMMVHIYGRRCFMDWFAGMEADENTIHNTYIVEDLAEAHGVPVSRHTDAACWSFYKNKIVAGQEGGAVWFRNEEHAHLARKLRSLGFEEPHNFMHAPRGHNYRMSNAHADCILASLDMCSVNLHKRRFNEARYDDACPREWRMPERNAPWVYDVRIPGMTRAQQTSVIVALQKVGIQARHAFKPMSQQPEWKGRCIVYGEDANADLMSREVIYLPLFPTVAPELAFRTIESALNRS